LAAGDAVSCDAAFQYPLKGAMRVADQIARRQPRWKRDGALILFDFR
jgi:hypothetical protein